MTRIVKFFLMIVLVVCIGLPIAFRIAASLRETYEVADILPAEGRLVATDSGSVFFCRNSGPSTVAPLCWPRAMPPGPASGGNIKPNPGSRDDLEADR